MKLSYFILILLLLWGANLSAQSKNYDKLFIDAVKAGNEKEITYYLNKGADVNAYDQSKSTALKIATLNCNFEIVYLLYKHGAKSDMVDNHGLTALNFANNAGCIRIVEFLSNPKSYKADPSFMVYYKLYCDFLQNKEYKQALIYAEKARSAVESEFDKTKRSIWPAIILENLARLYMLQYDYLKAEPLLVESVELQKIILGENQPDYIQSLNLLAVLYLRNGNFSKAESLFKECYEKYKLLEIFDSNYVTTCCNLGVIYRELGNFNKAERFLNEAISIHKNLSGTTNSEYATLLNNLATLYSGMGDLTKAEQLDLECINIRKTVLGENHPDYAHSLSNLGRLYYLKGDYSKSEALLQNALKLQRDFSGEINPDDIISTLSYLASLYSDLGNYSKAEKNLIEALQIQKKAFDDKSPEYARLLNNLAELYSTLGNYSKSEQLFLKAQNILEYLSGKQSQDYATTLDNLANLYRNFSWYEESLTMDLEIRDLFKTNHGVTDSLYIKQNKIIEDRKYCIKKYSQCDSLYLEALKIQKGILGANHPSCATTLNNLAGFYEEKGDLINAEIMNLKAKNIYEIVYGNKHPLYRSSLNNLAGLYWKQNDFIKPAIIFEEDFKFQIKIIQDNFSFLSENERGLNWKNTKAMFFETIYPSFAYSYYPKKPSISTFAYDNALFTKGLLLNTSFQIKNAILQSGDMVLISTWKNLRGLKQQINTLQSKPLIQQGNLPEMEVQADSLDKVLTQKSQLYKPKQSDMQEKWTDIQKILKPNEAAIEFISFNYFNLLNTDSTKYSVDSTMYCALVLKKNSPYPEMIPLFEEKQLDSLFVKSSSDINQLYTYRVTNLRKNTVEQTLNYGSKLYNLLWKPLEASLKNSKTVYFAPSGKLNQVAFSAIPVDSTLLLSDKYNLHQVTSTRQIIKSNDVPAKVHEAALFGGIQYELDNKQLAQVQSKTGTGYCSAFVSDSTQRFNAFGYLKGTGEEVTGIAKEFKQKGLTDQLFTGAVASEAAFKKLSGTNTDIIHIATHGFYLPIEETKPKDFKFMSFDNERRNVVVQNPLLRSGLAFAGANSVWRGDTIPDNWEDGILTSHEISQLNLTHTDLVVLSACETALGDVKGSEGVFGLQRAFKMAGVQTLIMSLWKVPDAQTSQLMQSFYKYWLGGMTKHDAFKKAQNEVRKANPNPYFWAAFVMVD